MPSGVVLSELITEHLTRGLGIHAQPGMSGLAVALIAFEVAAVVALTYALLEMAGRSHPAKHT